MWLHRNHIRTDPASALQPSYLRKQSGNLTAREDDGQALGPFGPGDAFRPARLGVEQVLVNVAADPTCVRFLGAIAVVLVTRSDRVAHLVEEPGSGHPPVRSSDPAAQFVDSSTAARPRQCQECRAQTVSGESKDDQTNDAAEVRVIEVPEPPRAPSVLVEVRVNPHRQGCRVVPCRCIADLNTMKPNFIVSRATFEPIDGSEKTLKKGTKVSRASD